MRHSGIYFIRCIPTNKVYVGSAHSIYHRVRSHWRALRENRHGSPLMQRSWNKYGEDSFEHGVLEFVPDKSQLLVREQHWIDNSPSDFNIARVAGAVTGFHHTEEERVKQSVRARKMWADPAKRAEITDKIKESWKNLDLRQIMSDHGKSRSPEFWVTNGEKIRVTLSTEEKRAERSENRRADWKDPVKRARILEGRRLARSRRNPTHNM